MRVIGLLLAAAAIASCEPSAEQRVTQCVDNYEKQGYPYAHRTRYCGMSTEQLAQIIECMDAYGARPPEYVEHPCIDHPDLRPGERP